MKAAGLVALILAGGPALAQHATPLLSGYAHAVDGATLKLGGVTIRLAGAQSLPLEAHLLDRHGQAYPAGLFARDVLASLVAELVVGCRAFKPPEDSTSLVAVCASPAAPDLALAMLKRGWAVLAQQDGRPEAPGYAPMEAEARLNRRGLWQGGDIRPLAKP
jgi:endonuclease YncB( thermonuclease family)